jgi:hypothetical protein
VLQRATAAGEKMAARWGDAVGAGFFDVFQRGGKTVAAFAGEADGKNFVGQGERDVDRGAIR